jgi:hypothetical protein
MRSFWSLLLFASMSVHAVDAPAPAPQPQPPFVADLIAKATAAAPTNPPTRIVRYAYRGKTVYFVPARCCDVPSALYDDAGKRLCEPDGGFVGQGDGRCADFKEQRRDEAVIWSDTRTSPP